MFFFWKTRAQLVCPLISSLLPRRELMGEVPSVFRIAILCQTTRFPLILKAASLLSFPF